MNKTNLPVIDIIFLACILLLILPEVIRWVRMMISLWNTNRLRKLKERPLSNLKLMLAMIFLLISWSSRADTVYPQPDFAPAKIGSKMGPLPNSPGWSRIKMAAFMAMEGQVTNPVAAPQPGSTFGQWLDQGKSAIAYGLTNCYWIPYGMYANGLAKHYGGGLALMYPWSQYIETGVRADYVNGGFWMPSGNATLQFPISVGPITVTPFTYAGIGVPISGAVLGNFTVPGSVPRDNNGQPTAILGAGFALDIYSSTTAIISKIFLIGDVEKWTGFPGNQWRFGLGLHPGKW